MILKPNELILLWHIKTWDVRQYFSNVKNYEIHETYSPPELDLNTLIQVENWVLI
jgi:hypothetical protein